MKSLFVFARNRAVRTTRLLMVVAALLVGVNVALYAAGTAPLGTYFVFHGVGSLASTAGVVQANPVISWTAAAPGTSNTVDILVGNYSSLSCTLTQTAHVTSPSTTVAIQAKDIYGNYFSLLTSAATTADNTPNRIVLGVGIPTTANVSLGTALPSVIRVQAVVGGSGSITGGVACSGHQ